ncbi:PAN domain protein [Dictyocaulus viviparus]|uniref:PAN domain protein n=1 Tax=Dictyocaulus viviparus TaxID=29172 RepID=A0A0D8XPX3_DICVI|nr:PAN domain protein [Dictyocaulus viviparus]
MNRERRTDRPDLFAEGVQDQLVDYLENNCLDVQCSSDLLHWIRTEDYYISHEKDVVIESMSLDECKAVCKANVIGLEKFPCRAFLYNAMKQECHLTTESGDCDKELGGSLFSWDTPHMHPQNDNITGKKKWS